MNILYCGDLQHRIRSAVCKHPLYVSENYNKLAIVLCYDDFLELQAYNAASCRISYWSVEEPNVTRLFGIPVKVSRLISNGSFEIVELDDSTVSELDSISTAVREKIPTVYATNCSNCGAPVSSLSDNCYYCGCGIRIRDDTLRKDHI